MVIKYQEQYTKVSISRKSEIIDILVETTGLHRKSINRKLNKKRPKSLVSRGGSKPKYPKESTKEIISILLKASDYSCAENIHPIIPELIKRIDELGYLDKFDVKDIELIRNIPCGI